MCRCKISFIAFIIIFIEMKFNELNNNFVLYTSLDIFVIHPCIPTVLKWNCTAAFRQSFNGTATENM